VSQHSEAAEELVEIRGNAGMYALVTVIALTASGAYAYRATHGGGWLDWVIAVVLGAVAVVHAIGWWDARTPRLVADRHGVRVRTTRGWTGTPWDQVESIEVSRTASAIQDGRLRIRSDGHTETVRYGAGTRASVADLDAALRTLGAPVTVPPSPATPTLTSAPTAAAIPEGGSRRAVRADVHRDGPASVGMLALQPEPSTLPEATELRGTAGRVGLVLETMVSVDRPMVPDTAVAAAPVDPYPTRPAPQPVIGPQLAAARERLGLSVDAVAERTRIRPHVIESVEVDDFVPCGGDFYARGHIRALARILGLEPEPLLASYDERYASAPIDARRVFEAELATGPTPALRAAHGGPKWAALLGMVMVLAILWAIARMLTGGGSDEVQPSEVSYSSPASAATPDPDRFAGMVPPEVNRLRLTAEGGSSAVAVRNEAGELVWRGILSDGEAKAVRVAGAPTVVAEDGGVVTAKLNGKAGETLGEPGVSVQRVLGSAPRR